MPNDTHHELHSRQQAPGLRSRPPAPACPADHIVYVVDDEAAVRTALDDLLASCGYNARTFGSADEFVGTAAASVASCLVLDINLPGLNGLDLQQRLVGKIHPPIIFITGHGDIPSSVRAMKAGAVDFLSKPFSEQQLLTAVDCALTRDRRARSVNAELEQLRNLYATLTPRERETLPLIVSGLRNKQAAAILGMSTVTIQIHRGNIMRKMQAGSLSDLVRKAGNLQIPLPGATARGFLHSLNQGGAGMNKQTKALIAVVDDDCAVLDCLEDLLESAGYAVRRFDSATAFRASGLLHSVECVVTDITMPGMSGLELEQHIRRERPNLPVVLITGHETSCKQAQGVVHARPSRFLLRKPMVGEALLAILAGATAKRSPRS